jgi:uncharacterized protein YcaQ
MNPHSNYPLHAVQTLALYAQGLTAANTVSAGNLPSPDVIFDTIDQMGCVQIDTLQMVHRSHYLALWSRLGAYDPTSLDELYSTRSDSRNLAIADSESLNGRRLFEYWLHAACLIPIREYRYRLPVMHWHRSGNGWRHGWTEVAENKALMEAVLARITAEGPLRTSDFEDKEKRRRSWWNWKPAKQALEHLYNQGRLMIAGRTNFQRLYDLPERVLPAWVDTTMPTYEETQRYWLERSLKAHGICDPKLAASMVQGFKRSEATVVLKQLIAEGVAVEVQAILSDGEAHALVLHLDRLPALQQAADGALKAERTTFLSPFDNLLWVPRRDVAFWNFRQSLEAYLPQEKRQYGYFTLPILHKDRFVGRFDPKLERATGTLRLKAIYLEPKVKADDELVGAVAGALHDFMHFHKATDLVIESSTPAVFGKRLARAMKAL